jgi:hypothetical protein
MKTALRSIAKKKQGGVSRYAKGGMGLAFSSGAPTGAMPRSALIFCLLFDQAKSKKKSFENSTQAI